MLFWELRLSIKDQAFKEELPLLLGCEQGWFGHWHSSVHLRMVEDGLQHGNPVKYHACLCSFQSRDIQKMKADNLHRKPLTAWPLHLRHRGFGLRAHLRSSVDPERFASWQNVAVCCIHLISSCENLSIQWSDARSPGMSSFHGRPWEGHLSVCEHTWIWTSYCHLKAPTLMFQISEVRNWLGFYQPTFFSKLSISGFGSGSAWTAGGYGLNGFHFRCFLFT